MREWNSKPQDLAFAKSIKPFALITLIQDGLAYDEAIATAKKAPRVYTFTNEERRRVSNTARTSNGDNNENNATSRKRARFESNPARSDPTPADAPEQVNRNNEVSGLDGHAHEGATDVDEAEVPGDAQEAEDEEPETVAELEVTFSTLETGLSTGVQGEDIKQYEDLTVLHVVNLPGSDIVHLSWSTKDPKRLLATGGSAWRSWVVTDEVSTGDEKKELEFHDHAVGQEPFFVTATAWSPSGSDFAVGLDQGPISMPDTPEPSEKPITTRGDFTGALLLEHDSKVSRLVGSRGTTLSIRWNPNGSLLLWTAVNSSDKGAINLVNPTNQLVKHSLNTERPGLDVVWVNAEAFIVCGASHLDAYSIGSDAITPKHSVTTSLTWEKLSLDAETNKAACMAADEGGYLGILNVAEMDLQASSVHGERITSLEWQPLQKPPEKEDVSMDATTATATTPNAAETPAPQPPRILATSSIDGTVKLWDVRSSLECLQTFSMAPGESAMILAFSPDGTRIAAASPENIIVWKAEKAGKILAKWTPPPPAISLPEPAIAPLEVEAVRGDGDDDAMVLDNSEGDAEAIAVKQPENEADQPIYTLSWNCDGSKLAFGQGETVRVILEPVFLSKSEALIFGT